MKTFNDMGFVTKITPLNDSDKIITIFSPHRGKIFAIAKGINKPRSRKAGSLDLLNKIDFKLYQGKADLDLLIEVHLINDFRKLKNDLSIINLNYYILELIDKFITGTEDNSVIVNLYEEFLDIQIGEPLQTLELITTMQLKIMNALGYGPMLGDCTICADDIGPSMPRIISAQGHVGYICSKHISANILKEELIPDTIIKIQKFCLSHSLKSALRLQVTIEQLTSLFSIHNTWLQNILEKKILTTDIIYSIIQNLRIQNGKSK